MTVLENIMLGVPKRTRLGLVDWRGIVRDVAPIARRVGIACPAHRPGLGALHRRELADLDLPRAGPQERG